MRAASGRADRNGEPCLNHNTWLRKLKLLDAAHLERLQRLGLTSYEARAYLALLRRDSSTAAETARLAGLPRQRVYDVLSSLVEKGLASTKPGKAVKYSATPPEHALESLMTQHRQQLAELERDTSSMLDTLQPAYLAGQEHTDPLEYIEVLRDRRAINERFAELVARGEAELILGARHEKLSICSRLEVSGHGDDVSLRPARTNMLDQRQSIHARHHDVGQEQGEGLLLEPFISVFAVCERGDVVTRPGQRPLEKAAHRIIVFCQQDAMHGQARAIGVTWQLHRTAE